MKIEKNCVSETDLLVIGGGINGTGVALDAATRGLRVVLCESKDLAAETSSASSKLVHGGLRYLEQYEFRLVKESLRERDILLKNSPHLVHPLRFILPHNKNLRPAWIISTGLFLYDFLSGSTPLKKSKRISLRDTEEGSDFSDDFSTGFSYSDCRIDDSRMVVNNALHAQEHGAKILLPFECRKVEKHDRFWKAYLYGPEDNILCIHAKSIVNAGGPWVTQIIDNVFSKSSTKSIRLVKGSHIVVPKLYEGNHAYILQNTDKRVIFSIPYGFVSNNQNEFTLVGTTDIDYKGDPKNAKISIEEINYLCELTNTYFKKKISPASIIWDYSGVRPLYDSNDSINNPVNVTRDYYLDCEDTSGSLPLISIFGGKITTYRALSEHVVNKLQPYFPHIGPCITHVLPSTGGDACSFEEILTSVKNCYPWLDPKHAYRLASSYGTKTADVLKNAVSYEDLGKFFGFNLYQKEIEYLMKYEWTYNAESLLWRRTKLGLWLTKEEADSLRSWMKIQLKM